MFTGIKRKSLILHGLVCLLLALAAFTAAGGTAEAADNPVPDGWYMIVSGCSDDRVLGIHDSSQSDGGNLELCQINNTKNQRFYLKYQNNGYYTIQVLHSGKYLHKASSGRAEDVYQWSGSGANYTMWKLTAAGSGYYYIESKSGNYLNNSGGRTTPGNNVITYSLTRSNAQKWKFFPTSTSTNPFYDAVIRTNISKTAAGSGSSGSARFNQNERVYFNASLSGITITRTELYVTPPGGSRTLVETNTGNYTSNIWTPNSDSGYTLDKSGTYNYTLRLFSGTYSKDFSGSFTVIPLNPFNNAVIRTSVSKAKASSGTLPSGSTTFNQNDRVYFNASLSGITITRTELYVTSPAGGRTRVGTDSGSYSSFLCMPNSSTGYALSKSGTYNYTLRLYSGSYSKDFSGSLTVASANPFDGAAIRTNVSKSRVTSTALPAGSTIFNQEEQVYFNITTGGVTISRTELYVAPPGGSRTLVETSTRSYSSYHWMAGSNSGYTLSKKGTYSYVLRLYSGSYSKDISGSITAANPFDRASVRTNVSKTKITSATMPSGATRFTQNDSVFFNIKVSNVTISKTELFVTPPGGNQTRVKTDSHSYADYKWMAGSDRGYALSKTGTYNYVLRLYSGSFSRDYSGSFSVTGVIPSEIVKYNVSKSKATSSSLPSGSASFTQGDRVYFNVALLRSGVTISKTELYVTPPNGNRTLVETSTRRYSNYTWMAGSGSGYTLSKSGAYQYTLRLYSGGSSGDFSGSITVTNPFDRAEIRTNVSKSKVTSSSLPSGTTRFTQNDRVFFNVTVSGLTITKSELYVTQPGSSRTLVKTDTHSYSNYNWLSNSSSGYPLSKTGTYSYVLRLYSGSLYRDFSGSISVSSPPLPSIRTNVSKTKITSNSLPTGSVSFNLGDRVFFNALLSGASITRTELYVTPPGGSQSRVEVDSNRHTGYVWMAGSNSGYTLNKSGTYRYVLRVYSDSAYRDGSGSFTVSSSPTISYVSYTGVDYNAQTTNRYRRAALDKAKKMTLVKWTAPVTFYAWRGSNGTLDSVKDINGNASTTFQKNHIYVGIPYSMRNRANDETAFYRYICGVTNRDQMETNYYGNGKGCGYGIDSAAFVCISLNSANTAKNLTVSSMDTAAMLADMRKQTPTFFARLSKFDDMKPGDILLKSGHVMLYVGKTGKNYAVFEANASDGKCAYHVYTSSVLSSQGYIPCKFKGFGD